MINKPLLTYILAGVIMLMLACEPSVDQSPDAVVSGYGKELTLDELSSRIPDHLSDSDSISRAQSIIQSWTMEEVLTAQAEKALPDERKDFAGQIESYRKSLLIYAYEEEYIKTKLDTSVSNEAIEEYYETNQENFVLKGFIVRSRFAALPDSATQTSKVRRLFFSEDPEDVGQLEEMLVAKNAAYFLADDLWMKIEELLEQVPLGVYNFESYLKKNEKVEFTKDKRLYFLQIKDYRLKDDVSPLDLERGKIRDLILHQRRKEMLSQMRETLYQQALRKQEIVIHE